MKKWAVLISAVGLAFSVSGCSSDYVMATKDGRMILTTRTPRVPPTAPPRHPAFLIFYFLFFSPSAMLILLCRGMPDLINKKEAGYAVSPYPTQFT